MERETFDLGLVHRGWRGRRLVALRSPLERGMEVARAALAACRFVACTVVSEFDVDGVWDAIHRIDGAKTRAQADQTARAVHDATAAVVLASHPKWRREPGPAPCHFEFGPDAPAHIAGSRLSGDEPFEFAYVRTWLFECVGGGDAFDALLDGLPLHDELVRWLTEAGQSAEGC